MKKVLFLIHDLGDGGAEKVLVNLVNNLDPQKYQVTLMTLFDVGINRSFLLPHIQYKSCFKHMLPGNSHLMKLFTPKVLHQLLIKEHYDIEVSYLEGPSARVISGCSDKNTRLISWIHVEQHTPQIAAKAFRGYQEAKRCYERFHCTVCVSEYVKKDFLSIFPELDHVVVRYNTNDSDKILTQKDDPVDEDVFRKNEIRLVGVGKIMKNKDFARLARVHCRLRKEGYPVHTYLLGRGPEEENIAAYIEAQGEKESFTFLGYQTNPYKYISRCDLFVCTSHAEGFSTAATEALIVGVPVVTTRVSGMEEMLGANAEYGIITEHDDQAVYQGILEMIQDKEVLDSYKKKAAIRGRSFEKMKTVHEIEKLFDEIAGEW